MRKQVSIENVTMDHGLMLRIRRWPSRWIFCVFAARGPSLESTLFILFKGVPDAAEMTEELVERQEFGWTSDEVTTVRTRDQIGQMRR